MSLGYSGSNFGIISTLNSGSGILSSIGNKTSFSFENTQNYTNSSISVIISGTNPLINLNLYYSQDNSGINSIVEKISSIIQSNIFSIEIKSNYLKVELELVSGSNISYSIQTIYKNSVLQIPPTGILSSKNSFVNQSISSGNEKEGEIEEVTNYSSVTINVKGISSGTSPTGQIRIEFLSSEGNLLKENIVEIQDITEGILPFNQNYTQSILGPFLKITLKNTSSTDNFTNINLTTLYHISEKNPTIRLEDQITNYNGSSVTKSILSGPIEGSLLNGGCYRNIDSFQNSLNINIRNPLTAFGEVLSAENTPFLQFDFTNGRPLDQINIYSNDTINNSFNFIDSKGTIECNNSSSSIKKIELKSNGFTKYKPGQGLDNRFTALFPNGYLGGMDQYAGTFTPEDSLCFGYFPDGTENPNNEFGIRYQRFGTQQKNRVTITNSATSNGIIEYNIGEIPVNVSILNGDNPSIIAKKSVEAINQQINVNYYGFTSQYYNLGDTNEYYIDAIANGIESNTESSFSINSNTTGSNIATELLEYPEVPTTTIFPQSSWNIDTCRDEGTLELNYLKNPSGFRLDPTKGNVYRIFFQYLGFGTITFCIEQNETDRIIPVHRIKYQNLNSNPSLKNPSMKLGIGISTNGGTLGGVGKVETSSMASFLQGKFTPSSIYRSFGYSLVGNEEYGVNLLTRDSPGIICGIQGMEIYESENSDLSSNYRINNSNIYFNTINFSINTKSTSTSANIILMLIKNPISITTIPSSLGTTIQKRNNDSVLFFQGDTITGNSTPSITQSIQPNDFSVVFEYTLIEQDTITLDISNLNILMSPTDSYYLCFYGNLEGNGNAKLDVSGSISYSVNM